MSLASDGQFVLCDGENCSNRVALPVALRPVLSGDNVIAAVTGWLFATVGGTRKHYCPSCILRYLGELNRVTDETEGLALARQIAPDSCIK